MVERNLAKVEVASSRLVSRSIYKKGKQPLPFFLDNGAIAKRLCTGLQIRVGRFDSGSRLHHSMPLNRYGGFFIVSLDLSARSYTVFVIVRWR